MDQLLGILNFHDESVHVSEGGENYVRAGDLEGNRYLQAWERNF